MKKYLIVLVSIIFLFLSGCTEKEYVTQPLPTLTHWYVDGLKNVSYVVVEENTSNISEDKYEDRK